MKKYVKPSFFKLSTQLGTLVSMSDSYCFGGQSK